MAVHLAIELDIAPKELERKADHAVIGENPITPGGRPQGGGLVIRRGKGRQAEDGTDG